MSAVTALASCCSTIPPMVSTFVAYALEVFVEAARNMVRKIGGFHGNLRQCGECRQNTVC
jgi:hypothetical protein